MPWNRGKKKKKEKKRKVKIAKSLSVQTLNGFTIVYA
jgi:hypothetical protein